MTSAAHGTLHLDLDRHPIADPGYTAECRRRLDRDGVLVLRDFFTDEAIARIVAEFDGRDGEAFYASTTHNVYLTPPDDALGADHPFNRQVASSKGLLADDQIPTGSPLRAVYDDVVFRSFLCAVLGIDQIHPYADDLSSVNVHFAADGQELGWHFDNSSFAVTMLLRAPEAGGVFEYVPDVRDADRADMGFERVGRVLDGIEPVTTLDQAPGDLVVFRGRNSMHRVTPTRGRRARMLVVFAYNAEPGIGLSESALQTFYGRTG